VLATENRLAFDLHDSWQARVLLESHGTLRAIILSVLAHNFDAAVLTLCALIFEDFDGSLPLPSLTTAAKISKSGRVVANVVDRDGVIIPDLVIFASEQTMRDTFRHLADHCRLSDSDRTEFFKCAQAWVVADRRLDPTFDPKDPDAKRLIH
jgi:hypothetical protein